MGSLGDNIKNARKRIGLTQEELAMQIGVTAQAVSRWESGIGMPDVAMIVPIAQALSMSTDALFGVEQQAVDETQYLEITRLIQEIEASDLTKEMAALQECQLLMEKVQSNPANFIYECCLVERTANLSRYAKGEHAKAEWDKYKNAAIRYGLHVLRFCQQKSWCERTHYGLAWIYMHEKDYASAREHISHLPSVSSNRLQESILAQLTSAEHGTDAMKAVMTKNLQDFTCALNKEILYAMEDFAWHSDPLEAVAYGEWGIRLIHSLSENTMLLTSCRGFTRDMYKYILHADLRADQPQRAAEHFEELKQEMQKHYQYYQEVLQSEELSAQYNDRQLQSMRLYTQEFIEQKQAEILRLLSKWHGKEIKL